MISINFKIILFVIVIITCNSFKEFTKIRRYSAIYNDLSHAQIETLKSNYNRVKRDINLTDTDDDNIESYNDLTVNQKQKIRMSQSSFKYGLKNIEQYPVLKQELDDFLDFMTVYTIYSQEENIRLATAKTYISHVKLFLGWYITAYKLENNTRLSIKDIFLNKKKESSIPIIKYIQWLHHERKTSSTYESNVLRGLSKLIKFRFATESSIDGNIARGKSYDDIPLVVEMRKQLALVQRQVKNSGRSSDEKKKWLTWEEYLEVINMTKNNTQFLIEKYQNTNIKSQKEYVALNIQKFLLLSFFSQVPDRQRTFREIEIGKNFIKEKSNWIILHKQEDYKTGKTYGERPPLILSESLTPYIDDFIKNWRPSLYPSTNFLFVQKSTGAPLTGDSIYSIVSRCCFKYKGRRTNPHLLRDMIVTHIRDSNASEKELESLALYMGHSLAIQRVSYDRRTTGQKVMPAINLLQSISQSKVVVPLT